MTASTARIAFGPGGFISLKDVKIASKSDVQEAVIVLIQGFGIYKSDGGGFPVPHFDEDYFRQRSEEVKSRWASHRIFKKE